MMSRVAGGFGGLFNGLLRPIRYGYANARVKGMKARLISREALQQLIDAPDIHAVIGILERTEYAQDMSALAVKHSGVPLVELALGRHVARVGRDVISLSPKASIPAVMTFLKKWDAHNLKLILLSKHLGHSNEDTEHLLVPAGVFTAAELKRIQAHASVEDVVVFLGAKGYGADLASLLPDYGKSGNLQPLLNAIDLHYYAKFAANLPPGMKDRDKIIRLEEWEVDNKDLLTILRGKASGAKEEDVKKYLLLCGTLRRPEVAQLFAAPSMEDAVKLAGDRYGLTGLAEAYGRARSLAAVEVALGRARAEYGLRALRTCVLSTGAIVGYLALMENEMANIRHVVQGKKYGLPPEKIRESVIIVG